jgi:hypothetical protein
LTDIVVELVARRSRTGADSGPNIGTRRSACNWRTRLGTRRSAWMRVGPAAATMSPKPSPQAVIAAVGPNAAMSNGTASAPAACEAIIVDSITPKTRLITSSPASRWASVSASTYTNAQPMPAPTTQARTTTEPGSSPISATEPANSAPAPT